jgi:PAS domain S-box-containing protein
MTGESASQGDRLSLENEALRSEVAALRAERGRLEIRNRALFENARDAILLMRGDRFLDCNAVAQTVFGCARDRILAATPLAFSPELQPDGQPSAREAPRHIERALAGDPHTFEWEHCRWDRTPFTAEVTLSRLELDGETLVQAIVRDVTVRKQIEEALRASERHLSLVLNNVSDVIFSIAVEPGGYRFAWVNRRFLEVTGLQERQIVGVLARDVIPPPAHALVFGKYDEAIRTGRPARWEEESVYPGGKKVGVVTVAPVVDAHGTCTQLVGMVHDITERKDAEEKIGKLNEDLLREAQVLEERVRVRTAQLAERNQELKDFAYTVSHDLKAPLRGIAGYANELDRKHRTGLSDRATFCVRQIITATTHLDQLIEDLLQYSRLDSETPSVGEVDLRELVGLILRDRELLIKELHAEVTLDLPGAAKLRSWERGLAQILSNLIDNALKYSRRSSPPRVHVAAAPTAEGWRLTVRDNGIGFDMKYHDRIFRLFNRLVRMEEFEGTGAGLAIAKKVLDKQKGRIWAESQPGQGATFFVELPTPQDAQQERTSS